MKKKNSFLNILVAVLFLMVVVACEDAGVNDPGAEYMPDMGHSIAYEANVYDYYSYNTWGSEDEYYRYAQPRKPVAGTIARGYAGAVATRANDVAVPTNGSVPYYYGDTEEERARATAEILENPYPITDNGLAIGRNLYNINCGICHGEKGDGNGWLVDEANPNAVYPAQPAIFTTDEFIAASPGRYYHSIMYGKNVMGAYADKLSYEERWQVIHHIRSLQAKEKGLVYTETSNTLNQYATPGGSAPKESMAKMTKVQVPMLKHGADHGGGHHEESHDGHSDNTGDHHEGNHSSDHGGNSVTSGGGK